MSSQPNPIVHAVAQRYADAWAANDLPQMMACYHDEVVFHYFGRSPLAGTHRGKAACLAVLKQASSKTNRKLVAIRDVLAGEHFALIVAVERFERDGRADEIERLLRYRVGDGKLAMTLVTLRPKVRFGGETQPDLAQLTALHHQAHSECFIANSVKSDVRCEPAI